MKIQRYRAVLASIGLHLLFAFIAALMLSGQREVNEDGFDVAFVNVPRARMNVDIRPTHRTRLSPTLPTGEPSHSQPAPTSALQFTPNRTQVQSPTLAFDTDALNPVDVSVPTAGTEPAAPGAGTTVSSSIGATPPKSVPTLEKSAAAVAPVTGKTTSNLTAFLEDGLPAGGLGEGFDAATFPLKVPEGQLGGILEGKGKELRGYIRLIRLKHSLSDWWQDPTAIPALTKWLSEHTPIRADMRFEGGALRLTDAKIMDAPLIIMTGHDKDITVGRGLAREGPLQTGFTPAERAALREYILERGGTLFFDDCGFNGLFANIVADELNQIFPEYPLEIIPHEHELYRIHYHLPKPPTGGDVFWGNENNAQPTQFRYQKGIIIGKRVAVLYNRKDYLCAMETAEIESRTMLRLRRSTDVYRFMSNLLIYALKYGGNTDRTRYAP